MGSIFQSAKHIPHLLDGLCGLLWEVPHQALQDGPGDVLFELGLARTRAPEKGKFVQIQL
jgi:hypothetical protein